MTTTHHLPPSQLDAARKPRCPKSGEIEHLFASRDALIAKLNTKGRIDAKDLLTLERSGKCIVASEHWGICTDDARHALLNDEHHFVRSCAMISES